MIAWIKLTDALERLLVLSNNPGDLTIERELNFALFLAHERQRHLDDAAQIDADIATFAEASGIPAEKIKAAGAALGRFEVGELMAAAKRN